MIAAGLLGQVDRPEPIPTPDIEWSALAPLLVKIAVRQSINIAFILISFFSGAVKFLALAFAFLVPALSSHARVTQEQPAQE